MTANLAAIARTNVLLNQSPISAELFEAFQESAVLSICPSTANPITFFLGVAVLTRNQLGCP